MVMDCRSRWLGLEQEGFGIVFIEAAACALAQVAGRSGGSHDAVRDGETGIIVDNPRNVGELVRAIASLVRDDGERARLARRALEVARFDFSWDQLASDLSRQLEPFDHDRRPARLA
jgi:phosphatidylinositol alpha-1,6-mannosyltransferase